MMRLVRGFSKLMIGGALVLSLISCQQTENSPNSDEAQVIARTENQGATEQLKSKDNSKTSPAEPIDKRDDAYMAIPGRLHKNLTFNFGGVERSYHFYEAGGNLTDDRPLVLVLHGGGGHIDSLLNTSDASNPMAGEWLSMAEELGLHVLIPQGRTAEDRFQWNDCRSDCEHCGTQDDTGFLIGLINEIIDDYGVDRQQIFVTGESNGGLMTLRLAQEFPDFFAGFGAINALMPKNNECAPPSHPVHLAFIVGTDDQLIPYEGGVGISPPTGEFLSAEASFNLWRERNQCQELAEVEDVSDLSDSDDSTVSRMSFQCLDLEKQLLVYEVRGGGHVVPSISQQVTTIWEALAGKQNHDIESARELWDFFRQPG